MKILVTSQSSAFGGVEKRLESEAEILKNLGWQIAFATPEFKEKRSWKERLQKQGCSFIEWNPYKFIERGHSAFSSSLPFKPSRLAVKRLKPDLAHVALPWTTVGMSRVAELQKMGIPIVLSLHCTYPLEKFSSKTAEQIHSALKGVVAAYAVSSAVRQSFLMNFGGSCKNFEIDIIHNGIDCKKFGNLNVGEGLAREHLGVSDKDFLFVFCGRLNDMKRPEMVIRLMRHELLKNSSIKMLMVGEGPLEMDLRVLAKKLGVQDKLIFLGFREDIGQIYNIADCYISTSNSSEGFGLAAGEALASGLPVILPAHPVFIECFRDCKAASFFDADSLDDCARKIVDIQSKPAEHLDILSRYAKEYAVMNLDLSIMSEKLQLFYKSAADKISIHD